MKFFVEIRPHSNKSEIQKTVDGDLKVFVKSPAVEGKANKEAIRLLSKHFSVPKTSIKIVSGAHSRKKMVEILT